MRYIDADRLKAEIEKRHRYQSEQYHDTKPDGRPNDGWAESLAIMGELEDILSLIDSLQQEQPSEDLEKEMKRFLSNITPAFKDGSYKITRFGFRVVARHFYELGKQSKEPVSEDLKEAAEEYEQTRQDTDARSDNEIVRRAFIAGAEWQKEGEL